MGPTLPKNKVGARPQAGRGWETSTLGEPSEQPHLLHPTPLVENLPFADCFTNPLPTVPWSPLGRGELLESSLWGE